MMPHIAPLEAGEPHRLGQFRIVGRIGEGGQGIVYLGENASGERAAIKLLHVKFSGDATARSRFAREARAAQRVASFCTAGVVDVDLEGDTPYIASEYIEGRSLREVVDTDGPLRGTALQRLAIGTATALTAIHHAAIVHRDFKPDNVLIAADGPRVVDFGIARIIDSTGTITSRAIGTPAYMAPEQISGADVGPHTDVFAWGATMAFAATGRTAFAGDSIAVVLNRILNHEVDVDAMPEPLRGVVRSALSKSPSARPSADAILLGMLGHPDGVSASPAVLNQGAQVAAPAPAPAPDRVPASPPDRAPAPAVDREPGSEPEPEPDPGIGPDEVTSLIRLPGTMPGLPASQRPPLPSTGFRASPPAYGERPPAPSERPPSPDHPDRDPRPLQDPRGSLGGVEHPSFPEYAGRPMDVPRPSRQETFPGQVAHTGPPGRSGRIGWIAAAVALLLVAGAGMAAFAGGWRPWAGIGAQPADSTPVAFSSVVEKAAKTGRLTIGLRDFLPGIALNNGGRWEGFEVELATEIAKKLGVPPNGVTFRATAREERPDLLAAGDLDLVVSTYSINDADDVTFAGPYYLAHVDVLVKRGSPIVSTADLEGRRVCQPSGSASVARLQREVERIDLVVARNYSECMNRLRDGQVDAVPGDDLLLAGFANRESILFKVVGLKLTDERYAVAMKKGDRRTCRAVRSAITSLYRNGTVGRLLDRHFSKVDFTTREDRLPAMADCG